MALFHEIRKYPMVVLQKGLIMLRRLPRKTTPKWALISSMSRGDLDQKLMKWSMKVVMTNSTMRESKMSVKTLEGNDGSSKLLLVDESLNTICPWYIPGSLTFSHKQSLRCTFKLQVSIILHCFYPISNLYELVLCGYSQAAAHRYH